MDATQLSVKDPLERLPLTFSFDGEVAAPATITGVELVVQVVSGQDAQPQLLLFGSATVAGAVVSQWVRDGVSGATYLLKAKATISDGRVLVRKALLPVKD